jgi:ribosomal protein L31E
VVENYQIVKQQVERTTTAPGLQVAAWLNEKVYQSGRKTE